MHRFVVLTSSVPDGRTICIGGYRVRTAADLADAVGRTMCIGRVGGRARRDPRPGNQYPVAQAGLSGHVTASPMQKVRRAVSAVAGGCSRIGGHLGNERELRPGAYEVHRASAAVDGGAGEGSGPMRTALSRCSC